MNKRPLNLKPSKVKCPVCGEPTVEIEYVYAGGVQKVAECTDAGCWGSKEVSFVKDRRKK